MARRAFTVQGVGGDNLALHRAVAASPAGHVLLADLRGARHGHWGEILAVAAQVRGLLGLVIDGGVRDVDKLRRLRFPVFSRHQHRPHRQGPPWRPRSSGHRRRHRDPYRGPRGGRRRRRGAIPAGQVERVLDAADARAAIELGGQTTCIDLAAISIPFLVNTAQAVLQRLQIRRLHLVGHSMNGLTALLLAHQDPSWVLSFVNIERNIAPEDCFLSRQIVTHPADDADGFLDAFIERTRLSPHLSSAL